MAKEIERKFLVKDNRYQQLAEPLFYRQGYLSTDWRRLVRVRIRPGGAFLAIKGTTNGITRTEYEYEIPINEAERILAEICQKPIIEKDRYKVSVDGLQWDIDEFHGANEGLVIAEVEPEEENQQIEAPEWIGREVSHEPKYYNSNLVQNPYSKW